MKRLLSFLLPIVVMLSSCKDNLQITGTSTVAELDGKTLYLKVFEDGKMQTIDSTVVAHGGFTLNAKVDSVTMACLFMGEMCLVPVVLEEGNVGIKLNDDRQFPTGTPLNDSLHVFIHEKAELEAKMEELSRKESRMIMDGMNHDSILVILNKEAELINAESDRLITSFITKNYDNVLGAGGFMLLTSNFPYPILNPQIETVLGMGTPYFLENAYVKEYVKIATENMEKLREEEQQ